MTSRPVDCVDCGDVGYTVHGPDARPCRCVGTIQDMLPLPPLMGDDATDFTWRSAQFELLEALGIDPDMLFGVFRRRVRGEEERESTGDPEWDQNISLTRETADTLSISYERAAVLVAAWATDQKRMQRTIP